MNKLKIDYKLLSEVSILSDENFVNTIIFSSNQNLLRKYLDCINIHTIKEYPFIDCFYCKLKKQDLFKLSDRKEVEYIFSIASAKTMMYISKKIMKLENFTYSGKGVNIAFIDTGIKPHCDFCLGNDRIMLFKDFVNLKDYPYDDNGHGTFVSGVCSGNGTMSSFKYSGIAPASNIISLKALNSKGEASANQILDAMQWVYDNHKKYNIKIVCMSFGSEPTGYNDPIMLGAEVLWREGVVVVAAAGNSGPEYETIKSPGVSSKIITVGGFDDKRENDEYDESEFDIAKFSSRGPAYQRFKPDLVTPSVDIISCGLDKNYATLSGTSVATPMVAGLVALMIEKYGDISPNEVKRILLSSCKPIVRNKNFEGYGIPQVDKFL